MEPLTHKPSSGSIEWNESYYFVFFDKNQNIGIMNRVGFKPNKPEGMTFLFVFLPDGRAAAFHATDDGQEYPRNLRVQGVQHQCIADGNWRYQFEGPVIVVRDPEALPEVRTNPELIEDLVDGSMNLEFHQISKTYEYSEHMAPEALELGKKTGDMHWEQIALINGNVRLGDLEYDIKNAMGQRDHTHGIREWTAIDNWFYFVVWFDQQLAINPAAVFDNKGRIGPGGFVFRDGINIPIMDIRLRSHELRPDGIYPSKTELEILDAEDRSYELIAKPGRIVPVPFIDEKGRKSALVQSFGEFELNGRKGGYGSYETLRRLD
jgi:hypothetical protein